MSLTLHRPSIAFEQTYLAGLDELDSDGDRSAWIYLGGAAAAVIPRTDFPSYVRRLLAREQSPAKGFVPDTVYWAIRGTEMVGRISLRHELNELLLRDGGHIGYIVRPSARRQGVATEMLRQILLTDRARAIGRLLLTCDEDNLASERSIRKNGGILENVIDLGAGEQRQKRFWITVR
jgi:predicted acetyltransferase